MWIDDWERRLRAEQAIGRRGRRGRKKRARAALQRSRRAPFALRSRLSHAHAIEEAGDDAA